jgi:hypothetical protein
MGSDDLFHKRKHRQINSLRRRKPQRDPYDMVLIVCEGKKTEPNYFCDLRDDLKLNTANILVSPSGMVETPRL